MTSNSYLLGDCCCLVHHEHLLGPQRQSSRVLPSVFDIFAAKDDCYEIFVRNQATVVKDRQTSSSCRSLASFYATEAMHVKQFV